MNMEYTAGNQGFKYKVIEKIIQHETYTSYRSYRLVTFVVKVTTIRLGFSTWRYGSKGLFS